MVAEKVRKNCIGKHGENKHEEPGPVIVAYTVVYIRTVVIKDFDTAVTNSTVFGAQWFDRATGVTETTQGVFPLLPIIKMCYLFYC